MQPRTGTLSAGRLQVIAALLALLAFGAQAPARAHAASPLTWSAAQPVDTAPPFAGASAVEAISCPSAALCVAVDAAGDVLTTTAPARAASTWTIAHVDGVDFLFTGLSCPARSLCAAVDDDGDILTSTDPTGGSGAWRLRRVEPGVALDGISCPTRSLCVAVDQAGNILRSTDPRSSSPSWTIVHVHQPSGQAAFACPAARMCVVSETYGSLGAPTQRQDFVTSLDPIGGASSWHSFRGVGEGSFDISTLSCPSRRLCLAGGEQGPEILTSTDPTAGTAAWHEHAVRGSNDIDSISCPSLARCFAGDANGDIATSTHPAHGAWSIADVDPGGPGSGAEIRALACPAASLCVGGDAQGNSLRSSNPTGPASAWTIAGADGGSDLAAVACPASTLCVALDNAGKLLTSTNPGGGVAAWRATPGLLASYPWGSAPSNFESLETATLYDLDCPTTALCVTASGSNLLISTQPLGGTVAWDPFNAPGSPAPGDIVSAVSCPTASACFAIDESQDGRLIDALESTDPAGGAGAWSVSTASGLLDTQYVESLTCPSSALCLATDTNGNLWTSTDPAAAGSTWSFEGPEPSLSALACATVSLCVGIDQSGNIEHSTDPAQPGSWQQTTLPADARGNTTVACPSSSLCVIAGKGIVSSTDPTGGTGAWHYAPLSGTGMQFMRSVSCASVTFCVAVGDDGLVAVGRSPSAHRRGSGV